MKNLIKVCVILVMFISLSGCSLFGGGQGTATDVKQVTIVYNDPPIVDPRIEDTLEYSFLSSPVPWDKEMVKEIQQARNAIAAMVGFLKDSLDFDSKLPWYKYKASNEFLVNQYNILERNLDIRDGMRDGLDMDASIIYQYVKTEIKRRLNLQRQRIDASEKTMNDSTPEASIQEMLNLVKTFAPLIGIKF